MNRGTFVVLLLIHKDAAKHCEKREATRQVKLFKEKSECT